ncbi:MAG: sugar ABC transporter permease [Spirochaetia bacterium]|nr:sugar ABC transporter permease [Spirochaetia bacterium]
MEFKRNKLDIKEKQDRSCYTLLLPTIVLFLLINIYPLIYSVVVSCTNFSLARPFNKTTFVGFANYKKAFMEKSFLLSFSRTIIFVFFSLLFELGLGLFLSLLLNKEEVFGRRLLVFFLLPMMLTPIIVGLLWRFMYNYDIGMLNNLFERMGLNRYPFLGRKESALPSIIVTDIWQWTPFVILFLYSGLQALPVEFFEAAKIDGAKSHQILWYITLPSLKKTIFITMLIRGMDAIREYDKIFTMTHGGPGTNTETVSYFIYRQGFELFDTSYACATSLLLLVFTILISQIAINKYKKND